MIDVVGYSVEDNSDIEKSVVDAAKKHFKDGNYDSAIKLYLGLLKTSASARLYFDVGLCYYKKSDYDSAIEYLTMAANLDIRNSFAYSYLGNCYFKKLDAKNAIENWTIARSLSPKDEFVCLNLAMAYFVKGMSYESVFYYQKYLKYSTNRDTQQYQSIQKNINELFETANDYFIQGERERSRKEGILAEKNYRLAIKKYPVISHYSYALADLYYDIKNYQQASVYYEISLREHSARDKEIILKLANCYEKTNDYRLAYCFYNRYLRYSISSQNEYLEITKKISNLKKMIDSSVIDITIEMAKQYYNNNEYYKSLLEYENCVILDSENKSEYEHFIKKLNSFINPESIITKNYIKKGKELLIRGEKQGANKYFTEVLHLANPKSDEYKLAKSKITNVK